MKPRQRSVNRAVGVRVHQRTIEIIREGRYDAAEGEGAQETHARRQEKRDARLSRRTPVFNPPPLGLGEFS